ncbi:transcriptional regulator [Pseudomonas rhodesiae]|uniref:transcriptional regulator n=1 Tax=Pseudomonas rhodesiae TaxID=76760 RepID=UPI001473413E|nr:transcriptional regulator [Pseudomonas rhodesiae]NMY78213.1 transcriptional regulator [Pseudomonas rhodesiae]
MSLRIAYASALQFLRLRRESSQQALAEAADPSYISRLEAGRRSVTLDASQDIAQGLGVDPLTLLVLAYAAERGQTPQEILRHLEGELSTSGLLACQVPSTPSKAPHPGIASARELRAKIKALSDQGLAPVEVAKSLGISRQRVAHHLKIICGD